uniref:tRNA(Ile)-lysidine synthase, chloroplastic n=1 Tax=Liagoropsis maxima TaxID=1653392 RepID=A0A1G4NVT6_9FLOR|nr:tRNA Ile-lysidine synthetase [Liagoropsis maxima]SCW22724.1 tRNA Ile-lysidine synthetase [Liagoropsis maxima]
MNTFLHKKLGINLVDKLDIAEGTSILLAISSGQDSLCLLKLFIDIKEQYKLNIAIISIDHQWRADSCVNSQHMVNIIQKAQIKSYLYQLRPKNYSELELRNLRYQIFLETAIKYSYELIATAHTASDQVETCIYNMIQGSNIDGLNSLIWKRNIDKDLKIIRPLLNFSRGEIKWFCNYFSLPIWFDYTNLYYKNNRSRGRHELIPYIKNHYSQDLERKIPKFLEKTYLDSEYLRQNTIKLYQQIKHPYFIAVNYQILTKQHKSLQLRLLELFLLHNTKLTLSDNLLSDIMDCIHKNSYIRIMNQDILIQSNRTWLYIS